MPFIFLQKHGVPEWNKIKKKKLSIKAEEQKHQKNKGDSSQNKVWYDIIWFQLICMVHEERKKGKQFKHIEGSQIHQANVNQMQIRKRKFEVLGSDSV